MSKLLRDRPPKLLDDDLACIFGDRAAILLQQIHYWVEVNREAGRNLEDGYFWTFNSQQSWLKHFPFWTLKIIKAQFQKLEKAGVLIVGNFNKHAYDRTKWYRIDYEQLAELETLYLEERENRRRLESQSESPLGQKGPMEKYQKDQPIPETNPEKGNGAFRQLQEMDLVRKTSRPYRVKW